MPNLSLRSLRLRLAPFFQAFENRVKPGPLFLSPSLMLLLVFAGIPVVSVVLLGFTEFNFARSTLPEFMGSRNFVDDVVFSDGFRQSLLVTGKFITLAVTFEFIFGFGIALLLYERASSKQLLLPVILTPMFITPVAVGLIFRFLLDPQMGVVSAVLEFIGIGSISWFTDPTLALASVIIADIWQFTPYMTILFLAGLESIPEGPLEAARVDGANPREIFADVILPIMKPVIAVALLIRVIDASKVFAKVFTMTNGGPGRSTETVSYYIFEEGFRDFHLGIASAQAATILLMLAGFGLLQYVIRDFRGKR